MIKRLLFGAVAALFLSVASASAANVSPVQTKSCGTGQAFTALSTLGTFTCANPASGSSGGLYAPTFGTLPTLSTLPNWLNQGSATGSSSLNGLTIVPPSSSGDSLRVRYGTAPSTPYSYAAFVCVEGPLNTSGNTQGGIGWYDGSAKLQTILLENSSTGWTLNVNNWTNDTTFSASLYSSAAGAPPFPCIWLGIKNDGTSIYYAWSADGIQFWVVYTHTISGAFLTSYADIVFYIDDTRSSTQSGATLMAWVSGAW